MVEKKKLNWQSHFRLTDTLAAAQLAARSTHHVITASEQLHFAVLRAVGITESSPLRWLYTGTKWVYTGIKFAPITAEAVLHPLARKVAVQEISDDKSNTRRQTIAVLNGVLGDQLADSHNPLAKPFRLLTGPGPATQKKAIFLHGLCMDQLAWQSPQMLNNITELGWQPMFVDYNSGLPLLRNANLLLQSLEQQHQPGDEYAFIGHSMGGLIAHIALQRARQNKSTLEGAVKNLICVGSPHQGAPMAQLGHWLEEQLSQISFTLPLTYLTRMRSAGIHDLNHGYNPNTPLAATRIYLVAGELAVTQAHVKKALGDGLVTTTSALGLKQATEQAMLTNVGHIELLRDARVWQSISQCLC